MRDRSRLTLDVLRCSGAYITSIRRSAGLSRDDLADLAGLHANTIANIERGSCDPSVLAISQIYVRLGCSGVHIEGDGFYPEPPSPGVEGPRYLGLDVPSAQMALVMGARVRERRESIGCSLDELSGESGVHANTIWNFEHGLVAPSLSTTYKIYKALGVSLVAGCEDGIAFIHSPWRGPKPE